MENVKIAQTIPEVNNRMLIVEKITVLMTLRYSLQESAKSAHLASGKSRIDQSKIGCIKFKTK